MEIRHNISHLKGILSFLCWLFLNILGYTQSYNGSMIRIIDGDTFVFQTLEGSLTVRLYGTDSPERDQPYSKESADFLSNYLHKEATLTRKGTDRYGRTLGILFIEGQDINLLSIKGGFAWHFKRYSSDQQYADAEVFARENKLGLWASENPTPPWSWRQN